MVEGSGSVADFGDPKARVRAMPEGVALFVREIC